ncbi:MAG: hypothetical protein KME43_13395 [Myxacorys chilensis ATA2-1-KO14]|nr:hypothetical protein [Myxacorys chilensis ATA2-1-KO14]
MAALKNPTTESRLGGMKRGSYLWGSQASRDSHGCNILHYPFRVYEQPTLQQRLLRMCGKSRS